MRCPLLLGFVGAAGLVACGSVYSAAEPVAPGGDASSGGDGAVGLEASAGDGSSVDAAREGGAGCPNGMCPTMLAAASGPDRLALSGTNVYWTSHDAVATVALDGTASSTFPLAGPIATGLRRGIAVAPGSGVPYVTMPGGGKGATMCAADLSSCALGFIGSAGSASSIAVTAANVYVGIFDDQVAMHGAIWQANLAGSSLSAYAMIVDQVLDLQVVGSTTYFRTAAAIKRGTPSTSPTSAVNLAGEAPLAFVVQNNTLVVATASHLRACALDNVLECSAPVVQPTTTAPTAVTADSTYIYWVEGGASGSVHRCSLPGCTNAVLLADGQAFPSDIVVDIRSVYWANHGDASGSGGAIMKLPQL